MEKINLKKLSIYCLFNKLTGKYDTFMIASSDEEARDYFLDQTAQVAFDLANKADTLNYSRLFTNLKDTCLIRVSSFDEEKGEFITDKNTLLDYITDEAIESYIKLKFNLKNKFMDLVPKKEGQKNES